MKAQSIILASLMSCVFFIGCNKGKNNGTRFVSQTITPVLIAQGELGVRENVAKQNLVIKTQEEWDNLINAMNINSLSEKTQEEQEELDYLINVMNINSLSDYYFERTEIDFSKYQIIAVLDGVKSNGGWGIEITDVRENEDSIVVIVQNLRKRYFTSISTQPYYIAKIPASEKKIVFQKEENNNDAIRIQLAHTKWKLAGIVDVETGDLKVLEPKKCAECDSCKCYTLIFENIYDIDDYSFITHTASNELIGIYGIDNEKQTFFTGILGGTKVGERLDGPLFIKCMNAVQSFSLCENELRLYYNENKNYLLFKSWKL